MKVRGCYLALLLAATLLGGLALAACDGGEDKEAEAPPSATENAGEPTQAVEAPTGTVEAPEPAPTDAFADLDSYRYTLTLSFEGAELVDQGLGSVTFTLDGSYVAPDRNQVRVEGELGDLALHEETIAIGDRSWVRSDDVWEEGEATFDTADLVPSAFFAGFDTEELKIITPTEETANGVDSFRYSVDKADIEQIQALAKVFGNGDNLEDLPEDFSFDLWLAKDGGWPVRIVMTARGTSDGSDVAVELSMDITDVNDADIEIEPPI